MLTRYLLQTLNHEPRIKHHGKPNTRFPCFSSKRQEWTINCTIEHSKVNTCIDNNQECEGEI